MSEINDKKINIYFDYLQNNIFNLLNIEAKDFILVKNKSNGQYQLYNNFDYEIIEKDLNLEFIIRYIHPTLDNSYISTLLININHILLNTEHNQNLINTINLKSEFNSKNKINLISIKMNDNKIISSDNLYFINFNEEHLNLINGYLENSLIPELMENKLNIKPIAVNYEKDKQEFIEFPNKISKLLDFNESNLLILYDKIMKKYIIYPDYKDQEGNIITNIMEEENKNLEFIIQTKVDINMNFIMISLNVDYIIAYYENNKKLVNFLKQNKIEDSEDKLNGLNLIAVAKDNSSFISDVSLNYPEFCIEHLHLINNFLQNTILKKLNFYKLSLKNLHLEQTKFQLIQNRIFHLLKLDEKYDNKNYTIAYNETLKQYFVYNNIDFNNLKFNTDIKILMLINFKNNVIPQFTVDLKFLPNKIIDAIIAEIKNKDIDYDIINAIKDNQCFITLSKRDLDIIFDYEKKISISLNADIMVLFNEYLSYLEENTIKNNLSKIGYYVNNFFKIKDIFLKNHYEDIFFAELKSKNLDCVEKYLIKNKKNFNNYDYFLDREIILEGENKIIFTLDERSIGRILELKQLNLLFPFMYENRLFQYINIYANNEFNKMKNNLEKLKENNLLNEQIYDVLIDSEKFLIGITNDKKEFNSYLEILKDFSILHGDKNLQYFKSFLKENISKSNLNKLISEYEYIKNNNYFTFINITNIIDIINNDINNIERFHNKIKNFIFNSLSAKVDNCFKNKIFNIYLKEIDLKKTKKDLKKKNNNYVLKIQKILNNISLIENNQIKEKLKKRIFKMNSSLNSLADIENIINTNFLLEQTDFHLITEKLNEKILNFLINNDLLFINEFTDLCLSNFNVKKTYICKIVFNLFNNSEKNLINLMKTKTIKTTINILQQIWNVLQQEIDSINKYTILRKIEMINQIVLDEKNEEENIIFIKNNIKYINYIFNYKRSIIKSKEKYSENQNDLLNILYRVNKLNKNCKEFIKILVGNNTNNITKNERIYFDIEYLTNNKEKNIKIMKETLNELEKNLSKSPSVGKKI